MIAGFAKQEPRVSEGGEWQKRPSAETNHEPLPMQCRLYPAWRNATEPVASIPVPLSLFLALSFVWRKNTTIPCTRQQENAAMIAPWENIDRARRAKGYTLKELAQRVGVSESAVQYWKNGKTISLDTMAKLALVLDTTMDALFKRTDKPDSSDLEAPRSAVRETPPPYGADLDAVAIIEAMPDEALQGTFNAAVKTGKIPLAGVLGSEMARREKQKQEPTGWEEKKT